MLCGHVLVSVFKLFQFRVLPQPKTINNFEHFYNQYTPTSSSDAKGQVGNYTYDENYMYIKTNGGWKRIALSTF